MIDRSNYACGIFVVFQNVFGTVDHHILLKKSEHNGRRGNSNKLFASYLNDKKQFVSISGYNPNVACSC